MTIMADEKKIYIGNLEYGVREEDISKALEEAGLAPQSVAVIMDRMTGRSKGFGFAEFATTEEAKKAIEALDGKELNGRPMRVNMAQDKPRKPRNDFGGGRGNNW
jgi:RNA recognition motif-containing protein